MDVHHEGTSGCVLTAQQMSLFWTPSHVKPPPPIDGVGAGPASPETEGHKPMTICYSVGTMVLRGKRIEHDLTRGEQDESGVELLLWRDEIRPQTIRHRQTVE